MCCEKQFAEIIKMYMVGKHLCRSYCYQGSVVKENFYIFRDLDRIFACTNTNINPPMVLEANCQIIANEIMNEFDGDTDVLNSTSGSVVQADNLNSSLLHLPVSLLA